MEKFQENTADLSVIKANLQNKNWLVACLCAAWCDTCGAYRQQFDLLQLQHPDKCFAWIDIEDQADLVDAVDIENFPTILIQHEENIIFFGTMLPDAGQVHRLLMSFEDGLKNQLEQGIKMHNPSLTQDVPATWNLRQLILNSD
ncbi:thioredoxin family protein [Undibacterium parvum]|uniref:Thioredoxin family protein n=2 Tax=Undibacterium TaxID=401469 RepID=A0A6M4A4E8_9BURK|nr:thioredoxin family protein [Undibacterium parvum]AZP13949.1 thioredoxin [Undibacterium parvum]QJQ04909.1 thioredoxin family protein [Undibacterium piscinae]